MILFENAFLKIRCFNSVVNQVLEVNIIEIMKNGKLIVEEYEFNPTSNRLENIFLIELPHTELKALTIKTKQTTLRGQTYCVASLQRGKGTGAKELITLLAGYISSEKPLSYPPIHLENATEGIGNIILITLEVEQPSINITSPTNTLTKIYQIWGVATLNALSAENRLFLYKHVGDINAPIYSQIDTFTTPGETTFLIAPLGFTQNRLSGFPLDSGNLSFISTDNIILLPNETLTLTSLFSTDVDFYTLQIKQEELFYI
jgi:hypothetical protein